MAITFARAFAQQLACPVGTKGRLLGGAMDLANRRPTRRAIELLAPMPGEDILDAGCGTGAALANVLRHAPCIVTGVDRSPEMVKAARHRLGNRARLCEAGIEAMPFADESFDAILALNMLYFADDHGHMVGSLRRVLRPGGRLVAYVTHRSAMERWSFARQGIHRLFDEDSLLAALVAGGFAADMICVRAIDAAPSVTGLLALARR